MAKLQPDTERAAAWLDRASTLVDEDEAYYQAEYAYDCQAESPEPTLCRALALNPVGQHCTHAKSAHESFEAGQHMLKRPFFAHHQTCDGEKCTKRGDKTLICCAYCDVVYCRSCIEKELGVKLDLITAPADKRTPFVTLGEHRAMMKKNVDEREVPAGKIYWVCERPKDRYGDALAADSDEEPDPADDGGGDGNGSAGDARASDMDEDSDAAGNCQHDELDVASHQQPSHRPSLRVHRIFQEIERLTQVAEPMHACASVAPRCCCQTALPAAQSATIRSGNARCPRSP